MWRLFFIAATLFNIAAGLPLLAAPDAMLQSLNMPVPDDLLYHRFTGLLILAFGGFYAALAYDQQRFGPLLWLGAIGKTGVILLMGEAYVSGRVPFQAFAVSLGDLLFVIGFLAFLTLPRKTS